MGISSTERAESGFDDLGSGPALMEVVRRIEDSRRSARRWIIRRGVCGIGWWGGGDVYFIDGSSLVDKLL